MKKYLFLIIFGAASLHAEIQFSGFFLTPNQSLYSLTDTRDGVSSGWLKIGQSFREYTVVSFDASRDVLTIQRPSGRTELRLRDSRVKDSRLVISGEVSIGPADRIGGIRATLFPGEEASFPLKDGITLKLTARTQHDGTILYVSRFVFRGSDGREEVIAAPGVAAKIGLPFALQVGDYSYAFTP